MTGSSHARIARLAQGRTRDTSRAQDHERGQDDIRSWTSAAGGRPLAPLLRHDMEQRFGHDFSGVRVHDDPGAAASASALAAKAFTVGKDIFFAQGRHAPETPTGKKLVAHELAHVVQQSRGGGAKPTTDGSGPLEVEAGAAADAAVSGGQASVAGASAVGPAADPEEPWWKRAANKARAARDNVTEKLKAAKEEVLRNPDVLQPSVFIANKAQELAESTKDKPGINEMTKQLSNVATANAKLSTEPAKAFGKNLLKKDEKGNLSVHPWAATKAWQSSMDENLESMKGATFGAIDAYEDGKFSTPPKRVINASKHPTLAAVEDKLLGADEITSKYARQVSGGSYKALYSMGEGIAKITVHPYDTVKGLGQLPGPGAINPIKQVGATAQLAEDLYDQQFPEAAAEEAAKRKAAQKPPEKMTADEKAEAADIEEEQKKSPWRRYGESFIPMQKRDQRQGKNLAKALGENYIKAWKAGRYGELPGLAIVDIGSFFIPGGKAGAAGKGAEVANAASKGGELANIANKTGELSKLGEGSKIGAGGELAKAGATVDAAKVGETSKGGELAKGADVVDATKGTEGAAGANKGALENLGEVPDHIKGEYANDLGKDASVHNIEDARQKRAAAEKPPTEPNAQAVPEEPQLAATGTDGPTVVGSGGGNKGFQASAKKSPPATSPAPATPVPHQPATPPAAPARRRVKTTRDPNRPAPSTEKPPASGQFDAEKYAAADAGDVHGANLTPANVANGKKIFGRKLGNIAAGEGNLAEVWQKAEQARPAAAKHAARAEHNLAKAETKLNEAADLRQQAQGARDTGDLARAKSLEKQAAKAERLAETFQRRAKDAGTAAYSATRDKFWDLVNRDEKLKKIFEDAGMKFDVDEAGKTKGAPYYETPRGKQKLTLEHDVRRSDDPTKAIEADNLMPSLSEENSIWNEQIRGLPDSEKFKPRPGTGAVNVPAADRAKAISVYEDFIRKKASDPSPEAKAAVKHARERLEALAPAQEPPTKVRVDSSVNAEPPAQVEKPATPEAHALEDDLLEADLPAEAETAKKKMKLGQ